jgi:hypothetical protein
MTKLATRVHRPLNIMSFEGGAMSSVNSSRTYIYVWLCSQRHLKPHERFFLPNYHFSRTDRFSERKSIPHNHADLCYMCDTHM